jgi:hypothetical protein
MKRIVLVHIDTVKKLLHFINELAYRQIGFEVSFISIVEQLNLY